MKRSTLVAVLLVGAAFAAFVGYTFAATAVPIQQKLDFVQDLRVTATAIIVNIDHLDLLRTRQISHGGSAWITTADLVGSVHEGITGTQINSAAADGPTLKAVLDASGGAIRSDLEAMR